MTVGSFCFASLYSEELKGLHSMQALVVQWKNSRLPRGRTRVRFPANALGSSTFPTFLIERLLNFHLFYSTSGSYLMKFEKVSHNPNTKINFGCHPQLNTPDEWEKPLKLFSSGFIELSGCTLGLGRFWTSTCCSWALWISIICAFWSLLH